jgi:hypothetical protein
MAEKKQIIFHKDKNGEALLYFWESGREAALTFTLII